MMNNLGVSLISTYPILFCKCLLAFVVVTSGEIANGLSIVSGIKSQFASTKTSFLMKRKNDHFCDTFPSKSKDSTIQMKMDTSDDSTRTNLGSSSSSVPLVARPTIKKSKAKISNSSDLEILLGSEISSKMKTKKMKVEDEPMHWIQPSDKVTVVPKAESYSTTSLCHEESLKNIVKISDMMMSKFSTIKFIVRGNPLPLRRHRTARGYMYNPSAAGQESFRSVVRQQVMNNTIISYTKNSSNKKVKKLMMAVKSSAKLVVTDDHDKKPTISVGDEESPPSPPFFGDHQQLSMLVIFRLKRPRNHFVSSKPGPGRLRVNYNSTQYKTNQDNDSMTWNICPASTSDIDNLAKFVLDSLNGVLYNDDKQIVSLNAIKLYDDYCPTEEHCCLGSTEICIKTIDTSEELGNLIRISFNSLL